MMISERGHSCAHDFVRNDVSVRVPTGMGWKQISYFGFCVLIVNSLSFSFVLLVVEINLYN